MLKKFSLVVLAATGALFGQTAHGETTHTSVSMVVRVTVDRSRTPQHVLDAATGSRKQFVEADVLAAMPRGKGARARVVFLWLPRGGRALTDDELEKEYELHNLIPADPYSLAKINEDDKTFAYHYPNATHWKNASGQWCSMEFGLWDVARDRNRVYVQRNYGHWFGPRWFAGLPRPTSADK